MARLIITRHGQTEWNVERRMQGQANSALTDAGREQALRLAQRLKELDTPVTAACSSDLDRAVETAEILCGPLGLSGELTTTPLLREIALGSWSGKLLSEVEKEYPKEADNFWHHPSAYVPQSGGETYMQLRQRAAKAVTGIAEANPGGTTLVVTHGIVIKVLWSLFRGRPIDEIAENHPHPHSCCLCEVTYQDGAWGVIRWNE